MDPMIGIADVERLLADPSPEARAETAAKIAAAFEGEGLSDRERWIAQEIIGLMVRDAEERVRRALSQSLQSSRRVPRDLALALADDVESVAIPMLRHSEVLSDEDLIAIVRGASTAKQVAVAGRRAVSAPLTAALIETAKREVVETLAANDGADITEAGMMKVLDDFAGDAAIGERLAARADIPLAVAERLVHLVSDRMRLRLITEYELPPATVSELIVRTRERATLGLVDASRGAAEIRRLIVQLYRGGRLTPSIVLRALCMGDVRFFEASIAVLARVPLNNARALIHRKGAAGREAVLRKAGVPAPLRAAFAAALEVVHETGLDGAAGDREAFRRGMLARVRAEDEEPPAAGGDIDYLLHKLGADDATREFAAG